MPSRRREITLVPAQPRPLQVRVALMEPHRPALGDLHGFGEVGCSSREVAVNPPEGGTIQEAARDELLGPGLPQAIHSSVQALGSLGKPGPAGFSWGQRLRGRQG